MTYKPHLTWHHHNTGRLWKDFEALALDDDTNVYLGGGYQILRINGHDGGIEVLAGTWKPRLSSDGGPASLARPSISGITVDKGRKRLVHGRQESAHPRPGTFSSRPMSGFHTRGSWLLSLRHVHSNRCNCVYTSAMSFPPDGCHSRASRTCCPSARPPAPSSSGRSADPLACRSSGGASTARA